MSRHNPQRKRPTPRRRRGSSKRNELRKKEDDLLRMLLSGSYKMGLKQTHIEKRKPDLLLELSYHMNPSEIEHSINAFQAAFGVIPSLRDSAILCKTIKRWRRRIPFNVRLQEAVIHAFHTRQEGLDLRTLPLKRHVSYPLKVGESLIKSGLTDIKVISNLCMVWALGNELSKAFSTQFEVIGNELVINFDNRGIITDDGLRTACKQAWDAASFEHRMILLANEAPNTLLINGVKHMFLEKLVDNNAPLHHTVLLETFFGRPLGYIESYLHHAARSIQRHGGWLERFGSGSRVMPHIIHGDASVDDDGLAHNTTMLPRDWIFERKLWGVMDFYSSVILTPSVYGRGDDKVREDSWQEAFKSVIDSVEEGLFLSNRLYCPYFREMETAMNFTIDADTRELILNTGLPSKIHSHYMHLPYQSMFLDVRLPLPSGEFCEGIFLHEIDDEKYEEYRSESEERKKGMVCCNLITGEEALGRDIPSDESPIWSIHQDFDFDIDDESVGRGMKRSWVICYLSTDGIKRELRLFKQGVSDWEDEMFPRPRKSGESRDLRHVVDFVIGLLFFIQLPDVDFVEAPKSKGNEKQIQKREKDREEKGLPALPERRVIRLTGEVKRYVNSIASGEGKGRRHHRVRRHYRILKADRYTKKQGEVIWVKSHERGWGDNSDQEYEVRK